MNKSNWLDVLEPRKAVISGIIGLALVYPLTWYAYHNNYVFFGINPRKWKDWGTAIDVLSFAVPYLLVRRFTKRR
jgi:hypothetical protein